jgi:MHS family proline/betaine transporter-like MFS transporter
VFARLSQRALATHWSGTILLSTTTFAVQISHAFFPAKNASTSLMATLITFGVGFFARPFGAASLGTYADKAGRKTALTLTVLLMACGSFMIAVCPTAATIGIAAPIILCLARLLQGFSAGGEIGGAIALLAEDAPVGRRAFYAALQSTAQGAAFVLCGIVALIVTSCFSNNEVNARAWRLPFLLGIVIAPVGLYIRRHIAEPELFTAQKM